MRTLTKLFIKGWASYSMTCTCRQFFLSTFQAYAATGFLTVQHFLDRAIISVYARVNAFLANTTVQMQRFPYPAYKDDKFVVILERELKFYIFLTFLFTAPMIAKDVALEKELKLKVSQA